MIVFKCYASGSSGNLYTVSDGQTTVMIECGLPWRKVREHLRFKTSEIAAVLLSHSHADHSKSTKEAAKAGMDIYASRETFKALKLSGHRYNEIADNQQFSIGTWTILPFKTIHDTEGSLGYYMQNKEGEAFLFIPDTAYVTNRFANVTMIAVECNHIGELLSQNIQGGHIPAVVGKRVRRNHMSLQTVRNMILANDLSKCRAIYLLHLSDANSDEQHMKREIQEISGVPVYVA